MPLTPATVRDWARDGVTAYAVAAARSAAAPWRPYFHVPDGLSGERLDILSR